MQNGGAIVTILVGRRNGGTPALTTEIFPSVCSHFFAFFGTTFHRVRWCSATPDEPVPKASTRPISPDLPRSREISSFETISSSSTSYRDTHLPFATTLGKLFSFRGPLKPSILTRSSFDGATS